MPPGIVQNNGHGYYALLAEDFLVTERIYDKLCPGIFFLVNTSKRKRFYEDSLNVENNN